MHLFQGLGFKTQVQRKVSELILKFIKGLPSCYDGRVIMKYELWHSKEGCSYTLLRAKNDPNKKLLETDAELLHVFEAGSDDDARKKWNEYMGWEPYKPME